ncbi:velvet factor-domain-containing protein [Blakeslea trispora]|nr:velvet factor-domain-containing protein [Blakeslea trispora]
MCGIGERVDRRPIDPPPVVQIKMKNSNKDESMERISALCSHLFLIAVLVPAEDDPSGQPNILLHSKLTVGRTVSSLYTLRDLDESEGAFFVFSDISVRAEGSYRLRMCLFDIRDQTVHYNSSVLTEPFTVYSAKAFPGMYRSCPLVQSFAKQGLKIRIRKESGPRPSRYVQSKKKDIRKAIDTLSEQQPQQQQQQLLQQTQPQQTQQQQVQQPQQQQINKEALPLPPPQPYNIHYSNRSISAFKRLSPIDTAPNKRRLSLSYLLDQSDSPPLKRNNDVQLAPIAISDETKTLNVTATFQGDNIKMEELPPILHYIPK